MKNKSKEMTFWEHVYELRRGILLVFLFFLIFTTFGYYFFPFIYDTIQQTLAEKLYVT